MKKILYFCLCALLAACSSQEKEFVVKGTTSQSRLEGIRVFLVPYGDKHFEDSIGVDSIEIREGKFEFRGNGQYLARITIDKMHRYGTQDLLIVTEPGMEVDVIIDSISSGGGTPQNELLQHWKDLKCEHDRVAGEHSAHLRYLRQIGDTVYANALTDSLRQFNKKYLDDVLGMTKIAGEGPATEFLTKRYAPSED